MRNTYDYIVASVATVLFIACVTIIAMSMSGRMGLEKTVYGLQDGNNLLGEEP